MDTSISIPNDFPRGCSKKELDGFIAALSKEAQNLGLEAKPSIPRQSHRAYIGTLIQLAQSEKRDRVSTRLFWLSTSLAFVSAFVAGVALYVSYLSLESSSGWEEKQLEKVDALVSTIEQSNVKLNKSNIDSTNTQTTILVTELKKITKNIETVNKQFKRDAASVAP